MDTANYNIDFNKGWLVHIGELPFVKDKPIGLFHSTSKAGGAVKEYDIFSESVKWERVSLPHDFMTCLPVNNKLDCGNGYKKRTVAWYYKKFFLEQKAVESARLVFDGVMGVSTVIVNGTVAVRNFSGYNRFSCEVGDYLIPNADNEILVYVDAKRWEGWWYEGAGIYRSVFLQLRSGAYFDSENYFFRAEEVDGKWQFRADFKVHFDTGFSGYSAKVLLCDERSEIVCEKEIEAKAENVIVLSVDNPVLWSPEKPALYSVRLILKNGDKQIDLLEKNIGFRKIEWVADKGMLLNGERYPVKGICCHQDHAGVGIAVTPEIFKYRIKKLKRLGINAYRCAHNAPSEDLLDICDKAGMLVMVENRNFSVCSDVLSQIGEMVLVARNHPCVFIYSIFNEEPWQTEKRGARIAKTLRNRILKFDETRKITAAQNGGILNENNASDSLDVIGVNYCLRDYESAHLRTPDKVMLGTENCPTYATRGVAVSDAKKHSFSNYGDEWGDFSERLEDTMEFIFSKSYVAGCFAWSGFDYRGEPVPYDWPSVVSHWGFMDICGFEKDTAYLLKAYYDEKPFVHLLPHWNHKKGETVRVCCFSNCESAELFLNGVSVGTKRIEIRRAEWQVKYRAGEICVIAGKGDETVTDKVVTAGKVDHLSAISETENGIKDNDGRKLVNIYACDKKGVVVPNCMKRLTFEAINGKVIGVGNGNPNSHHIDSDFRIKMFNGKAQVIFEGESLAVRCEGVPELIINL